MMRHQAHFWRIVAQTNTCNHHQNSAYTLYAHTCARMCLRNRRSTLSTMYTEVLLKPLLDVARVGATQRHAAHGVGRTRARAAQGGPQAHLQGTAAACWCHPYVYTSNVLLHKKYFLWRSHTCITVLHHMAQRPLRYMYGSNFPV